MFPLEMTAMGGFLSTPSARRATAKQKQLDALQRISIHALREEGDLGHRGRICLPDDFYPRPPRGGRRYGSSFKPAFVRFLSTPSARRATWPLRPAPQPAYHFYPRPPRGGRLDYLRRSPLYTHFYPRPPRGGRHVISGLSRLFFYFYPRPPRGGRRCQEERKAHRKGISIHALREEGDRIDFHPDFVPRDFYPRPPRGGRPGRKRAGGDGG